MNRPGHTARPAAEAAASRAPAQEKRDRTAEEQSPYAKRLGQLSLWRRRGLLLIAGAASVLAMAPFFLSPVLFLTLPVLVLATDEAAGRFTGGDRRRRVAKAFGAGWWFGFGYHLAGLFWIGEAFLVEAETFAALMPFAVTAMPAGLALFFGGATAVAAACWRPGLARVGILALTCAAAEWLRGHLLTGFPWNVLGYALTFPLPLMQAASILGIYGLTLVAVAAFAWPGTCWIDGWRPRHAGDLARLAALAATPFVALAAVGATLLAARPPEAAHSQTVRIVQPSVPQREKWRPENQERIFRQHIALSKRSAEGIEDGGRGVSLILWPEASMPFLPLNSPVAIAMIADFLPQDAMLASGALRLEEGPAGPGLGAGRRIYNSLLVFGGGARLVGHYDKIHLVPFGEYLPLQPWLEAIGLQQLTKLRGGFAAGVRPRPHLQIGTLPTMAPLICYEAIFPGAAVQQTPRPAVLINVTNDGWFGNTSGPRQHLHQARVRAVEEGLPLLRAANNGISAIIDAQGRLVASLGMDEVGVIDGRIPGIGRRTLYSLAGDWLFLGLMGIIALWLIVSGRRAARREQDATGNG
jgi:apolipoprotein N-acyltransferase